METRNKIDREEVEKALYENLEEIIEKLWRDTGDRVKFWIRGKDGSTEISFSSYMTGNTQPNPANWDKNEWMIELQTWNDIYGVSGEKIEKWKEEGEIHEVVQEIIEQENCVNRWVEKAQRVV